jgi:hypothetical protein
MYGYKWWRLWWLHWCQWYKVKSNLPLEVIHLNFQKSDVEKLLSYDVQLEIEQLTAFDPQAVQYHHIFCHSLGYSQEFCCIKCQKIKLIIRINQIPISSNCTALLLNLMLLMRGLFLQMNLVIWLVCFYQVVFGSEGEGVECLRHCLRLVWWVGDMQMWWGSQTYLFILLGTIG